MFAVQQFEFEQQDVRILRDPEGNPWWVAAEVCAILSLKNPRQVLQALDADEIRVHNMDTNRGPRTFNLVNESGLYTLILRSRKPEARRFRKWVTAEVLPSIHRTGRYQANPKDFVEKAEVSLHALRVFQLLKDSPQRWWEAAEIAQAARVAPRTARFYAHYFTNGGIVDQLETFPRHRYRYSDLAEKRNPALVQRLNVVAAAVKKPETRLIDQQS
jgi:prophage antirepressor-like protein